MPERNRSNPPTPSQTKPVDGDDCWCAAANGMNLLQHEAVEPQTRVNYAASLVKFGSWLEQREEKVVFDADIDAAMCTWVEKVYERESGELRRTVAQCLDGQAPIVQKTRCPEIAKDLEKHPGLAAPLTWTLEETLGVCSMVMDRVQTGGARPTFNVTVGLLSFARPGELLRMRPCDLVPPLRGALQNFSVVLTAEETGRPTKVRTFNDTLELNDPLARNLVSFWEALRGQGSKKTVVALHLSNFLQIFTERNNRFDVATNSTLPMETLWAVNRYSRRLPDVGASQHARTLASHANCPTMRETLPVRTKLGNPARKSPTASPVARRPAHGSSGTWWLLLKGHFVALIGSGTRQVCNELRKQGVTARMRTGDELTEPSAFR